MRHTFGPYEGVCYDGPHEGRPYKQAYSHFRVAVYEPPMAVWRPTDYVEDTLHVCYGTYRWSHALRKWVFAS